MSLACVVLALLTGQVAAATIVRSHAASLKADAQTAQSILAHVEELAESHPNKVGRRPEIWDIKQLAKELEEALKNTIKIAENDTNEHLDHVEKCNADQAKAINQITDTTKVEVGKERDAHVACRQEEMKTHADMITKCTALKDFLKGLEGPTMAGSEDDEMVDYVVKMDEYWCPKGPIAKDKQTKCKKAVDAHKADKDKCDILQTQFEIGFCTWRVQLMDACYAQHLCYDRKIYDYNKHKSDTLKVMKKWETECVALKKISCYVKVWLEDGNTSTVSATALETCKKKTFIQECKFTQVDFKKRKPADRAVCSVADVEKYPGTEEFKTTEYGQFLDMKKKIDDDELSHFIKEPTACAAQESEDNGPVYSAKWCRLGGDPHVTMFDRSRFSPIFAPGHWWLVNTANSHVKIQATYGGVGVARNGGWQAWGKTKKFHGIPPTAVTSLAFSGKFMKDSVLVVQTPCDWDYDEQKCLNTDTIPRITWNGEVMKDDFEIADPPVSVSNMKGKDMLVKLPDGVLVKVQQWGNWKPATNYMAFNVHINMPRFSTGVCGHCGNYDADWHNDYNMYNKTGFLANAAAGSLCKAEVHCKDRLITETFTKSANVKQCVENKPSDVTFDMSDCPEEQKEEARAVCDAEFGKQGKFANEEEKFASYQACLMDACLDPKFAAPDAEDAKEADDEDAQKY